MAKNDLTIRVHIDGLKETLAALAALPKEANAEIRKKAAELSKEIASAAAASGRTEGRQAALVAKTVKARRDRVPVVVAGGARKLGRNKKPAFALLFGSEFGATRFEQYKPHLGQGSYWFFRTIEDNQVEISAKWLAAADAVIREFGEGG